MKHNTTRENPTSQGISHTNANENVANNSNSTTEELITIESINKIISVVSHTDKTKHFLAFGRHRLTDDKPTKEEAIATLDTDTWWVIANLMCVIVAKATGEEFLGQP